MCSIIGWHGNVPKDVKAWLLQSGSMRGRDGFGFINPVTSRVERRLSLSESDISDFSRECAMLANFRATPTTEAETKLELLQPYNGIVHNGTIANDKEFGSYAIDSMCLPSVLDRSDLFLFTLSLKRLQGSYAIAAYNADKLFLACNYKPIYYVRYPNGIAFASTANMLPPGAVKMKPYSTLAYSFKTGLCTRMGISRSQPTRALVSCSGGLDSTTVAYMLKEQGYEVGLVHFLYGCNAETNEVKRVKEIAADGGFKLYFAELPKVFSGTIVSGTFHSKGVEGSEYAHDWVSARNLLMLSTLTAMAETHGYGYIAFGGNLEEAGSYPDNEEEFGNLFNALLPYATQNGYAVELLQPLARLMKHEVVKQGIACGTPYDLTWSCYSGMEKHCQTCGPCYMRKTAFERNGLKDPVMSC